MGTSSKMERADGLEMETPGRTHVEEGWGGHGEILKRGNKEDKENIQVTHEHLPTMHPAGSRRSQVHTRHNNRRFDFPSFIVSLSFFTLIRKEMPNPLKQHRSVDHKGHQL